MKKIILALCLLSLTGCAQKTYNKWNVAGNIKNGFNELSVGMIAEMPEAMYCYDYSLSTYLSKFESAFSESLDIIKKEYSTTLTRAEAEKFGYEVGDLAAAIYIVDNEADFIIDSLPDEQKKMCEQVMTPNKTLLSKR